ncbi:MAG TPA: hypothetical protein VI756_14170 [Blastocatellia bacterium]
MPTDKPTTHTTKGSKKAPTRKPAGKKGEAQSWKAATKGVKKTVAQPLHNNRPNPKSKPAGRKANGQFEPGNNIGFKRGESGNPVGRNKAWRSFSEAVRERLAELKAEDPQGRTRGDALVDWLFSVAEADKGRHSLIALRELLDRGEGKSHQTLDINSSPFQSDEWTALRSTLLAIAERHPEFRAEVLAAIDGANTEETHVAIPGQ